MSNHSTSFIAMKTKLFSCLDRRCKAGFVWTALLTALTLNIQSQTKFDSTHAITGGINAWPQGRIPYVFAANVTDPVKQATRAAMNEWMDSGGGIAFVEEPNLTPASKKAYLTIVIGSANESNVGPGVPTTLTLVASMREGAHSHATHELGHALGYYHEQSRPDRNAFVTVHDNRIASDKKHNFDSTSWDEWPPGVLFTPYSYDSIMHYDWCLGSIPGCGSAIKGTDDTMTTTDPFWQYRTGGWIGNDGARLAESDKRRAQLVYGKAIWVDKGSDCTFADGRRNCDVLGFIGPYKTIPDAVGAAPETWLPGIQPRPTIMIKTGTYSRGSAGILKISKPVKLVAWEQKVRIE